MSIAIDNDEAWRVVASDAADDWSSVSTILSSLPPAADSSVASW